MTTLPSPKPTLLAPPNLTNNSSTGDIFRQPEVRELVHSDFLVLPCDIISELDGTHLLQQWFIQQVGLAESPEATRSSMLHISSEKFGISSYRPSRRSGLSVWYPTKGDDIFTVKKEQTDFMVTAPIQNTANDSSSNIRKHVTQLVHSIPTDSLKDMLAEKQKWQLRHELFKKFPYVNIRTTMRDAHIYFFPRWIIDLVKAEYLESIGEDLIDLWAKASWQEGLARKAGLCHILNPPIPNPEDQEDMSSSPSDETLGLNEKLNIIDYTSTRPRAVSHINSKYDHPRSSLTAAPSGSQAQSITKTTHVPPILAYLLPQSSDSPLIRRVDTIPALLAVSLQLAKLQATSEIPKGEATSPIAHANKVAHPDSVSKSARVETANCLIAENVTVGDRCHIKESVIGIGCEIGQGVRLNRCVLMDHVKIGDNVTLADCIVGRHCSVEGGARNSADKTELQDCQLQNGYVVSWGSKCLFDFPSHFLVRM